MCREKRCSHPDPVRPGLNQRHGDADGGNRGPVRLYARMSIRKRICAVTLVGLGTMVLATAVSNDHAIASWPYQFGSWVAPPLGLAMPLSLALGST